MQKLIDALQRRILIIDGAMGTMVQRYKLDESAYRGKQFASHPRDLKGAADVLNLTQPQIIEEIHRAYLEAGADIIETNTFNAQAISVGDYGPDSSVFDMNLAAANMQGEAFAAFQTDARPRVVPRALGPTHRTPSVPP